MPVPVPEWPETRPSIYPFAAHADGKLYLWRKGQDYTCAEGTLTSAAQRWAKANDLVCETRVKRRWGRKGEEATIEGVVIQLKKKSGEERPVASAGRTGASEDGPAAALEEAA